MLSQTSVNAAYFIKDAPQSLLFQSHADKKRLQGDGWGVGWFVSGKPQIFKSPEPFYQDDARVQEAVHAAQGNVLLGHVRWASNPLKLPREELIGLKHTQPFVHDEWMFIHNGTLYIPNEVKAALGPLEKFVEGRNDSEVLFYWLLKTVIEGRADGYAARLQASFHELDKIWQGCKARYPIYRHPYHGLNWVLTNGKTMLAFCYVSPDGFGKSKALCGKDQPYFDLQMKQTENELIVASEPLASEPGWQSLGHGRLLIVDKTTQGITTQQHQVM